MEEKRHLLRRKKDKCVILNIFFYRKPLIATVEKQLLGEHLTAILQKGNLSSL